MHQARVGIFNQTLMSKAVAEKGLDTVPRTVHSKDRFTLTPQAIMPVTTPCKGDRHGRRKDIHQPAIGDIAKDDPCRFTAGNHTCSSPVSTRHLPVSITPEPSAQPSVRGSVISPEMALAAATKGLAR